MNLIELCIKRPALTIVMSLVITVFGVIGYSNLAVRWIPNINPPMVFVHTEYPGASANLVESNVTTPLETALASVDGIDTIESRSREGISSITLNFKLGHSINAAMEDVRSALQQVMSGLPKDVKQPDIGKADLNGMPILFLAFNDGHRSEKDVSDYVKRFILPRMQSVDGVASITTYGGRDSAMRIWLDPMKMAASSVTADDISTVLSQQNIQVPSGQIRSEKRYYSVIANETLKSAAEFNDLIVRHDQNQTVRLKDIGIATVDAADSDTAFRANGKPAIAIGIIPQSNANPLDVAHSVLKEFNSIKQTLPTGMQGSIVFNQATFIEASVHNVYESLAEAIILVLLVILFFLASLRAAVIPIITIPVCLIGTFAVMYWCGFSINTISLMALVLAIGLVVDDAIVMLENIMRHIESGMKPFAAAIKGGKEIVFPIIAMTLTLAAVYAPIAMTSGILSSIFREFALTLAVTVLISGFVALTLSPMMCSKMLKVKAKPSEYEHWLNEHLLILQNYYRSFLEKVLAKKRLILAGLAAIGVIGFSMFHFIPAELAPAEDMDEVDVYVNAPRNASFALTDSYARQLESLYNKLPELDSYVEQVGGMSPSKSFHYVNLVPRDKRKKSSADIANEMNEQVKNLTGVTVNASPASSPLTWSAGSEGSNILMSIMSTSDYKELHSIMERMIAAAKKYPGFLRIDSMLKWDGEQFEVKINREKAVDMNVPLQNITNTISTLLAGRTIGHYEYGGNQYDVMLQMNKNLLADPNIISQLYVRNNNNKMLPLSDLVTVTETTSPESLPHYSRLRSDVLSISLAPGVTIADGVGVLQKIAQQTLPDNAKYEFMGEAKNYLESNGKMLSTFLLALIFIYLILVAQFESFIDPFIILLTVPFAMIGALLTLKVAGGSLNIYSDVGLVTLIGLIAKHGILITDFANKQRMLGKSIQEAVIEAAALRLRPILMTTAAMVLGALPLALASGPGSETRHQIGWVIVGGLLLGTFFSLVVVPVAYTYLARFKKFAPIDGQETEILKIEREHQC